MEIGAGRLTWHPGPFWSLIGAAASLLAARLSTDTILPSRYSVGREIPGNVEKSAHRCGDEAQQ